jgi:hypothetical protein
VKGIAFERFLGRTFRGEIGQFFTPRTIVEFMVRMVEPKEGEVICDPASGSGGFLIRFFDIVRQQILADADRLYRRYASELDSDGKQRSEASGPSCCASATMPSREPLTSEGPVRASGSSQIPVSTGPTPTTAWPAPAR